MATMADPIPGDGGDHPVVRNALTGTVGGSVVQVGIAYGGVHLHHRPEVVVPRQLPAVPPLFAGRADALAALDGTDGTDGSTAVIWAIGGAGGIGKTWLALHWAEQRLDRFPDGQLFADLRGFSPTGGPVPPETAVRGFLDALGVEPDRIPSDLDAQAALYRSLVADRRMLVVLDNAASVEQVAHLLPGGRSCTVVVTSRRVLTGLVTRHGARHLPLDVLTDDESRTLLARRLGTERLAADPAATTELLTLCRGLPLALAILAGRAHADPDLRLAQLVAELHEIGVGALDDDDPTASLPAALGASHRALTVEQQQAFGLLAIAPGPDIGLPAAVSLTGLPAARAARLLRTLQESSLLSRGPGDRYAMHDLIRRHAAETAEQLPVRQRTQALRRVVDFYLHTAHAADHLLYPRRHLLRLAPPAPGVRRHRLPDSSAAMAWFDTEHANLLAAQHTAAAHERHRTVWHLAWVLDTFHYRRAHRHDRLAVWQAALDAACHLPDPVSRISAHRNLGIAHAVLEHAEEATGHLRQALVLAEHHPSELARTHQMLAWAWQWQGDLRKSLDQATLALALHHTLDQPVRKADTLNQIGWYAALLGDHVTARSHCQAALILHREHHNTDGEATALDGLGYVADRLGDHRERPNGYQRSGRREEVVMLVASEHDPIGSHPCRHRPHPRHLRRHRQRRALHQGVPR